MNTTVTFSSRTILKALALTALFGGLLYAAYLSRTVLVWIIASFALALALDPAVKWFSRFMPKKSRAAATLVVFTIMIILLGVLGFIFGRPLVSQTEQLIRDIPSYQQQLLKPGSFTGDLIQRYDLVSRVQASQSELLARLSNASGSVIGIVSGVFSGLLAGLTILGLTFFMLMEGPTWHRLLLQAQKDKARREHVKRLTGSMYHAMTGYVTGKLLAALLAGLTTAIMLVILGVPFAVPLGLVVGLLSILPLVGATIGALIVCLITLFTSVSDTIIMAIFFVLYQQVENNVIQPVIFNKTVSVSPLLVFVSVLIGTVLGGILGALIAIPVTACLQILVKDYYERSTGTTAELELADGQKPRKLKKA